jgi:hypothetical protein
MSTPLRAEPRAHAAARIARSTLRGTLTGAVALTALSARPASAADHRDGAAVEALDQGADITDVYAWMRGSNAVLAMNVHRDAGVGAMFSDAVQYAFHVRRHPAFALAAADTVDVICEFDEAQMIQCWVGDEAYITGDAGAEGGITTPNEDVRVFAGPRQDPFFFYEFGFNIARTKLLPTLGEIVAQGDMRASGCPDLGTSGRAILGYLEGGGSSGANPFVEENVLSIVIELDSAYLVDADAPVFSVWGSTHVKPD